MRSRIAITAGCTVVGLALAACSSGAGTPGSSGSTTSIGFIAATPRNDGGFTQNALAGVNAAVADGGKAELTSIVDNVVDAQAQIQGLQTLAARNSVVVADGSSFSKPVEVVAAKFPKVRFILVSAYTDSFLANVTSIDAAVGYDAIVAGAVASTLSRSKKLGMLAGLQVATSASWYYGMAQGATLGTPGTQVVQTYTGDYNNVGKAKDAADAMIATGVDSILADLDSGTQGVYQAAGASSSPIDVYQVFGLDCDASKNVVGSGLIDWSSILQDSVTAAAAGTLPAGAISYGLNKGAVKFQFCPGKATPAAQTLADSVTEQLIAGQLVPAPNVLTPKPSYAFQER
jgi:basic membrane protein A and related proteins